MSHFSVLVRVPANVKPDDFEPVLEKMLLPYKEAGSKDSKELEKYLVFYDEEDEHRKKYETATSDMVRLVDGEECCRYDHQFRNKDLFATPQYIYPEGSVLFEVSHKERFKTFEQYMEEYCGFDKRDKQKNRYGYWQNPQRKWDWFTIGGRWTGYLLIGYDPAKDYDNYKRCWICHNTGTRADTTYPEGDTVARQPSPAGHPVIGKGCNCCRGTGWELKFASDLKPVGNYLRISELNWEQIEQETKKNLDAFWEEWQGLCNGKQFDPFDGPRDQALRLGLLDCKEVNELTGKEWKVIYWDKPDTPEDEKRNRCDVIKQTTKEWLLANYFDAFSPISSWARLDETEWKEKGEMGWWGANDATADSVKAHVGGQREWLEKGNQQDWLIIVDAHI